MKYHATQFFQNKRCLKCNGKLQRNPISFKQWLIFFIEEGMFFGSLIIISLTDGGLSKMLGLIMFLASFCIIWIFRSHFKVSWQCKDCGSVQG